MKSISLVLLVIILLTFACKDNTHKLNQALILPAEGCNDTISINDLLLLKKIATTRNVLMTLSQERIENITLANQEKTGGIINGLLNRAVQQILGVLRPGKFSWSWQDFDNPPRMINMANRFLDTLAQGKDLLLGKFTESGKLPSHSLHLHAEIYRLHSEISSIILTQAPNIMALGVSHNKLDVKTIPKSWIFLQDIKLVEFGKQFSQDSTFPNLISKKKPSVIVQNDGIIVTGIKLLQTFDWLEVAEFAAKSLVNAHPLGDLVPIGKDQIENLRKKFLS